MDAKTQPNEALVEVLAGLLFKDRSGKDWHASEPEDRVEFRADARTLLTTLQTNNILVKGNVDTLTSLAVAMATKPAVTVFDFQS